MKTTDEWMDLLGEGWTPDELIRAEQANALAPFLALLKPAVDKFEEGRTGEPMPPDEAPAVEIYSWALGLTWGEVRRALALIPRPADDTPASRA